MECHLHLIPDFLQLHPLTHLQNTAIKSDCVNGSLMMEIGARLCLNEEVLSQPLRARRNKRAFFIHGEYSKLLAENRLFGEFPFLGFKKQIFADGQQITNAILTKAAACINRSQFSQEIEIHNVSSIMINTSSGSGSFTPDGSYRQLQSRATVHTFSVRFTILHGFTQLARSIVPSCSYSESDFGIYSLE
ncbi:hypothetical protein AVEN_70996-1 [Araneus ventricosus]|uniref:Uncharacterized protein n=1 Tax=Araneus ventricosus TaxID=182803 RepID=A0A4Y2G906_ARAVE|nr:hypothetical protein AVEN_70996-1 [Araneus ventricosus]